MKENRSGLRVPITTDRCVLYYSKQSIYCLEIARHKHNWDEGNKERSVIACVSYTDSCIHGHSCVSVGGRPVARFRRAFGHTPRRSRRRMLAPSRHRDLRPSGRSVWGSFGAGLFLSSTQFCDGTRYQVT